jgi:hypothetical protein
MFESENSGIDYDDDEVTVKVEEDDYMEGSSEDDVVENLNGHQGQTLKEPLMTPGKSFNLVFCFCPDQTQCPNDFKLQRV